MRMKIINILKVSFLTAILFLSINSFGQEKKWTLEECISYALENNITVNQGNNNLLINEQDIVAAKGNFLPSVSASTSHGLSLGTTLVAQGIFANRTSNSTNFGIGVSQSIFNGFRNKYIYEQSKLNFDTNKIDLQRIKDDISLSIVDAYLTILFNKENLEIALAHFEFSEKQVDQIQNLVDAGVQPKANIYDAEATLSRDEQSVTIAENNLNLALLSLSQLLQVPFTDFNIENINIDTPSEVLLYNDVSSVLSYALQNRNEIKVAENNIEIAQLGTKISKSGYYPSVNFSYGLGSNAFYSNLVDNEADFVSQLNDNKGHSFNLSINIPIFSRFQNKVAVTKSKIRENNSMLDLKQAKLNLESNIQRAFTDAQAAFKAYEAAKKSLASQELAFNNSRERYNIGNMTSFELEQARINLLNAQSSIINAKYDFVFKTKVLDFYMGKSLTN